MEIYNARAQIYYCLNFSKITLHELQKNLTSSKLVFMVYKGLFIIYRKGWGGGGGGELTKYTFFPGPLFHFGPKSIPPPPPTTYTHLH